MHGKIKIFLAAMLAMIAVVFGCDFGSEDDSADLGCPVAEKKLIASSGEFDLGDCDGMVKYIKTEDILVSRDFTYYEIHGKIFIDFETMFFLRGEGAEDEACLCTIVGQSPFTVRLAAPKCQTEFYVEVLFRSDPDAAPACTLTFNSGENCALN